MWSGCDCEESPGAGDAFELVFAPVLERDPRASDEVPHSGRYEYLRCPRLLLDTRREMYGHSRDLMVVSKFDLTGVDADPDLQVQCSNNVAHCTCTFDGSARSVEGSDEAIAASADFAALKAFQLSTDGKVVRIQDVVPLPVAQLCETLGRADDVGEEHGREDPIGSRRVDRAGKELFDLVEVL